MTEKYEAHIFRWWMYHHFEEGEMKDLVGKRIRLVQMFDPDPIPVGSMGTINFVNKVRGLGFTQIGVAWDNGRTLMLSVPPDKYEVVAS